MAKRIQRKRTKGWKMPPNTVYVGRPTLHGNPFQVGMYAKVHSGGFAYLVCWEKKHAAPGFKYMATAQDCVDMFREYMDGSPGKKKAAAMLRGKDLACWCEVGDPCHADVLLEIANAEPPHAQ